VEQHLEALKDRPGVLGFGTTNDTTEQAEAKTEIPTASKSDRDKDFRSGPRRRVPVYGRVNARPLAIKPSKWARRDSNARPLAPEASALSN
jgi:hypothetical protein